MILSSLSSPRRLIVPTCLAVVVAVLGAACGHAKRVRRPGDEYLDAIQIVGNHAISTTTLIDGTELHRRQEAGRSVDDYQLAVDTTRIAGAYQRLGYLSVDVKPRVDHNGDAVTVTFTIVEGPRATTRVEITGLPADVPAATARALVALADGAPFDYARYDAAKAPLLRLVEDAGYAHARLDAGVLADRTNGVAVARYVFDAGPACTFGKIELVGVDGALADAVRARVDFHEGERYSSSPIAATQAAIYGLGRFATARVDPQREGDATVIPVKIAVAESSRHEARAGGGVGLDPINSSIRLRGTYTVLGWPFDLSTTTLDFKPAITMLRTNCEIYQVFKCGEPVVRLIGNVTQQDLLGTRDLKGEVEGGLDYLTIEAYRYQGLYGRLGLVSPIGTPRVQARIGWLLGRYTFDNLSPAIDPAFATQLGIDRAERLGEFRQALTIDLRDHPIETRYGLYAELRVAEGTRYAGGAYQFVQITPELRGFVPLGPMVLALRARLGTIVGDVPPTERYYAGGASSDRGFPERQMSPIASSEPTTAVVAPERHMWPIAISGPTSVVVGGAGLIETGGELRIPLGKPKGLKLGGVAFVDGGDTTFAADQLDPAHLHWAVGLGIRWFLLPIGPLRLDFAYRLGNESAALPPLGRFQWFVSVGEAY